MAFVPAPLTLLVRAKVENGKVYFLDETKVLVKYHHVEQLFRASGKGGRDKERTHDKALCGVETHQFAIEDVLRVDGVTGPNQEEKLSRRPWSIVDAGTLDEGLPKEHLRKRAERRQVMLSFDGKLLLRELASINDGENTALYDAFIEQGTIQLNVLVDGLVTIPLLVKLVVLYQ